MKKAITSVKNAVTAIGLFGIAFLFMANQANAVIIGPNAYLSSADSPFNGLGLTNFVLEDFQSYQGGAPDPASGGSFSLGFGATLTGNSLRHSFPNFPPGITDSVDADDGDIDDSGNRSSGDGSAQAMWATGNPGITVTFALGMMPTHAGLVWTDGAGLINFEAFDENGGLIGSSFNNNHADSGIDGGTAEDRFYGAINLTGISSMRLWNTSGGIEVDHIQFGGGGSASVPEPSILALFAASLFGIGFVRRRNATNTFLVK